MLRTHHAVETYRDHTIYQRQPGFEFTPITLGKVASFLVQGPDGGVTVHAFLYSLLAELEAPVDEGRLLAEALAVIREAIASPADDAAGDRTYEHHDGRFVAVREPRWWIPTRP